MHASGKSIALPLILRTAGGLRAPAAELSHDAQQSARLSDPGAAPGLVLDRLVRVQEVPTRRCGSREKKAPLSAQTCRSERRSAGSRRGGWAGRPARRRAAQGVPTRGCARSRAAPRPRPAARKPTCGTGPSSLSRASAALARRPPEAWQPRACSSPAAALRRRGSACASAGPPQEGARAPPTPARTRCRRRTSLASRPASLWWRITWVSRAGSPPPDSRRISQRASPAGELVPSPSVEAQRGERVAARAVPRQPASHRRALLGAASSSHTLCTPHTLRTGACTATRPTLRCTLPPAAKLFTARRVKLREPLGVVAAALVGATVASGRGTRHRATSTAASAAAGGSGLRRWRWRRHHHRRRRNSFEPHGDEQRPVRPRRLRLLAKPAPTHRRAESDRPAPQNDTRRLVGRWPAGVCWAGCLRRSAKRLETVLKVIAATHLAPPGGRLVGGDGEPDDERPRRRSRKPREVVASPSADGSPRLAGSTRGDAGEARGRLSGRGSLDEQRAARPQRRHAGRSTANEQPSVVRKSCVHRRREVAHPIVTVRRGDQIGVSIGQQLLQRRSPNAAERDNRNSERKSARQAVRRATVRRATEQSRSTRTPQRTVHVGHQGEKQDDQKQRDQYSRTGRWKRVKF